MATSLFGRQRLNATQDEIAQFAGVTREVFSEKVLSFLEGKGYIERDRTINARNIIILKPAELLAFARSDNVLQ